MGYVIQFHGRQERLREVARLARAEPAGRDRELTPTLAQALRRLLSDLQGDSDFHLRQELLIAAYRFLVQDPMSITQREEYRIRCACTPDRFADFIDELLDPTKHPERLRQVARARSLGNGTVHGYFNAEVADGNRKLMDEDLDAAMAHEEELLFGNGAGPDELY